MSPMWWIILGIITVIAVYSLYKLFLFVTKTYFLSKKAKDIRFLSVKVPRKESEQDKSQDNIQSMKQNLEIMNQIYKNFYSIYSTDLFDRKIAQNYISLEMLVKKEVIQFIVGVPKEFLETFEKTISSFIPGSEVEQIDQPKILDAGKFAAGGHFVMEKDQALPIKTYENFEADPMDSLLSAFSRVEIDEVFNLQIVVSPLGESWQSQVRGVADKLKKGGSAGGLFGTIFGIIGKLMDFSESEGKDQENNGAYSSTQTQDIEKKAEDEGFDVVIRALAVSPYPEKANKIINDLTRAFSQYNYIGLNTFVFLKAKNIDKFIKDFVSRNFKRPFFTFKKMLFFISSQILSVKELCSIYHFPHSRFNKNPRIRWQNFKIVPAPDDLPTEGIKLGTNLYSGVKKDIILQPTDRFRHFYVIGQTGTGKSTMLLVQAKQDLAQGRGFCMIDPHGDLCEFALKNFPKERINDLIYFDAADFEMPIGFNIFEAKTEEEKDIILNDTVEMFIQMYGAEIFGPRIQDYFRHSALTLMDQPDGGTMTELVRLFVDDAYQQTKVKNVKSPVVRAWWDKTFKNMGQREKQEIIPFYQSKFGPFTTTPIIRNIIGQPKSSFDIGQAMQEGKVILLNLSKGKMGELNSQMLGTMMVTQIKLAALRRAQMPEDERNPFFMYIDEFQNYITPSIETILSEARKYRLGLVLAHQYIDQLAKKSLGGETDLKASIFGNIGSIMSYKVGAKDAEFLEQEFSPTFSRADLVNMDRFKGVLKMSVNTQPTRPFSLSVTNPYDDYLNTDEKVKIIKEISRLKWGRKKELVEKEIFFRIGA